MSTAKVSGYKVFQQEMSVEEVEGVEHSQYSGEGSLCWFGITRARKNSNRMCPFLDLLDWRSTIKGSRKNSRNS